MTKLVLFSSANKQGNTAQLIEEVAKHHSLEVIDIDALTITPYNYQNNYPTDDFYPLVEKILAADKLIFASPVYWHAPTATIKALIDRITELTDVKALKIKARSLAHKPAFVMATSASDELCPIFNGFFEKVFAYFDMQYLAHLHVSCREGFNLEDNVLAKFNTVLNK
ncbi:flavodoxin family protein [Pseudoalteromonas sp.]|uniref:flavodoxin family protein n=1 Tax=Pseudoalteromonas sp. TaxID=53249 RepID=UPI00356768A3